MRKGDTVRISPGMSEASWAHTLLHLDGERGYILRLSGRGTGLRAYLGTPRQ